MNYQVPIHDAFNNSDEQRMRRSNMIESCTSDFNQAIVGLWQSTKHWDFVAANQTLGLCGSQPNVRTLWQPE